MTDTGTLTVEVEATKTVCPLGEVVGKKMIAEGQIPVISCEGGCFRGEIARVAAHLVAKEKPYCRGCHGEVFTAPRSAMAEWARKADKVVVIDGCFMHCHGRIMKNIVGAEHVVQFDAMPMYNKDKRYSRTMLVDEVPEAERKDLARQVADKVLRTSRSSQHPKRNKLDMHAGPLMRVREALQRTWVWTEMDFTAH